MKSDSKEPLPCPVTSQASHSRANSEKSVDHKLVVVKETSDMSNTTQCCSVVKSNAAKIEAFTKEEHAVFEKP